MARLVRSMIVVTVAAAFVVALRGFSVEVRPDIDTERQLIRAAECGSRGDFASAIALSTALLDRQPANVFAYVIRGTAHRRAGEYSRAIVDLDRAIELDSRFAGAYTQRAFAYQQSGKEGVSQLILADANRAIELDPSNPLSFIVRGSEYSTQGDQKAAIRDFDEALRLNPSSYSALANRAGAKILLGTLREARQDLLESLDLNPPQEDRQEIVELLQIVEEAISADG